MSILTAASQKSVYAGYNYYKENRILSCEKIGEDLYQGTVQGSGNNIYNVTIDINHPRKSFCDCPHANGTAIVCKHKVALFFSLFPEEAQDYEDWLNSGSQTFNDYDDDYDDKYYDDYDEYDHYHYHQDEIPYCYEELLDEHINNMSVEDLKNFVRNELNNNKYNTFKHVLRDEYKKYLDKNQNYLYIEKLHNDLSKLLDIYDYDFTNFNIEIINSKHKQFINNVYGLDKKISELIDRTLLDPMLAQYSGYKWVINFYKNRFTSKETEIFSNKLFDAFNGLKHYGIKNKDCKANILINLYYLNDYDSKYLAKSIVKNSKYFRYVEYVINKSKDIDKLYIEVKKIFDIGYGFDKKIATQIILTFIDRYRNNLQKQKEILYDFSYYDFVLNNNERELEYLIEHNQQDYLNKIKEKIKTNEQFIAYYSAYRDYDNLYKIIKAENKTYLYNKYQKTLKDKYNKEIYDYYKEEMYAQLEKGMGRDIYRLALSNLKYIKALNKGEELIESLYKNLKESKFNNRPALFDEFRSITKTNYR